MEYLRQRNNKTNVSTNSHRNENKKLNKNASISKDSALCTSSDSCQANDDHFYNEIVTRIETNEPDTEYDHLDHTRPANYDGDHDFCNKTFSRSEMQSQTLACPSTPGVTEK